MAGVTPRLTRLLIEAMAKHLPPSAASLRLLDVDGAAGRILLERRADLELIAVAGAPETWQVTANSVDAVVAFSHRLEPALLAAALTALRPGGRLIAMETEGEPDAARVTTLEAAGYTRILVETGVDCPLPTGVLMRGEKPHETADTLARIHSVAGQDEDADTPDGLAAFRGKYLHVPVIQTPNKPAWALTPDEPVRWQAITVEGALLVFSSLPKAVSFMQTAVLTGTIRDVNKVAKFSRATAQSWTLPVRINPPVEVLTGLSFTLTDLDPATAETPDE